MSRTFRPLSPATRAVIVAREAAAAPKLATVDGFNRSAIMLEAVRNARTMTWGSWSYRMSCALKATWKQAKQAASDLAFDLAFKARVAALPDFVRPIRRYARNAPTAFVSGSRAFSHGW